MEKHAPHRSEYDFSTIQIRIRHFAGMTRQEAETERGVRAVLNTVEADEALGLAQVRMRIARTLAVHQTEVAIGALIRVPLDAPQ